jgi:hypothetical protein
MSSPHAWQCTVSPANELCGLQVKWARQQVVRSRQKRDLMPFRQRSYRVNLNDPRWPQMWYLVSVGRLSPPHIPCSRPAVMWDIMWCRNRDFKSSSTVRLTEDWSRRKQEIKIVHNFASETLPIATATGSLLYVFLVFFNGLHIFQWREERWTMKWKSSAMIQSLPRVCISRYLLHGAEGNLQILLSQWSMSRPRFEPSSFGMQV